MPIRTREAAAAAWERQQKELQEQQRRQQEDQQRQQEEDQRQQEQRRVQEGPRRRQRFADYSGEPGWMQRISNSTICSWFYTFFLANLIVFFLVIGAGAYTFFRNKRHITPPHLFFALLQLIVAGTNMLFFYLICDRSLKPSL
jgi:hypothetical protein